jgi:hypothetical protein
MPYKTDNIFQILSKNVTFAFNFKDYFGQYIGRTIDTIVFQNCNIKDIGIYYYPGSSPIQVYSLSNNSSSDIILNIQEISTSRIEFRITNVFGGYNGIQIGQLRILDHILDLNATTDSSIEFDSQENSLRSYNGRVYAWLDYAKWACNIKANAVSKEQYNILCSEIVKEKFLTIIPWQDFEIKDVYQIYVQAKDLGYDINRFSGKLSFNIKGIAQDNASVFR